MVAGVVAAMGAPVSNRWDFWFFPKRETKNGSDLAATRRLYPALATRFPGLARAETPEGDAAKILVASVGDPEALAALKAGRRVVLLDRNIPLASDHACGRVEPQSR